MANLHIISFIQNLTTAEIKVADDFLNRSTHLINESEDIKEYKLFKHLISNKTKNITDEEVSKIADTKWPSKLKKNLFDKVLESLTFDKHIQNHALFTDYEIKSFTLKKKLLVCKISYRSLNQGKIEAVHELLNEIIDESKEFELYDLLSEALAAKKYLKGIRLGYAEFEKINAEIEHFNYCYKASLNAADNYYRLILNNDFVKTLSKKEIDNHIERSIKQMETDYKKTRSENINYYLQIMQFAFYERQKNYVKAIDHCNRLIALLKKSKIVYREERMGFALTNLSQFKIFTKKYSAAASDAKNAQKYYLENSFNYAISKEQEFYAHFHNEDYGNANKCLHVLSNHSTIDTGEFRKSKYIYYQAYVHFADKKFKEALHLLNESLEIEKDKTRWNISLRILNIMIFLELEKINEASSSLESLRKYMERTGKQEEIGERDVLIVKFLREMEKNGFQLDKENKNVSKILSELSVKDKPISWEHYSSELIPFHEWVKTK